MGWCTGDEVDLGKGLSSCSVDTFEAALALLAAGGVAVAYLLHISAQRTGNGLTGQRKRQALATGGMVIILLIGHFIALISELVADHTRHKHAEWHLKPSRIFFSASFIMLYLVISLLMLVGAFQGVPVPSVRRISYGMTLLYLLHTVLATEERNQNKAQAVSVLVPALQLMCLLGFAVVVTVKCAPLSPHL